MIWGFGKTETLRINIQVVVRCAIFADTSLYMANCQEKDSAKNPMNAEVLEFGGTVCCWVGEVG